VQFRFVFLKPLGGVGHPRRLPRMGDERLQVLRLLHGCEVRGIVTSGEALPFGRRLEGGCNDAVNRDQPLVGRQLFPLSNVVAATLTDIASSVARKSPSSFGESGVR